MAKKDREIPLTRWRYFTKTLYHDPAQKTESTYNGVVYEKSPQLQSIEDGNRRINGILLIVLCVMFITSIRWQNIVLVFVGMFIIVAGEGMRFSLLPKDIQSHLTDTGRRKPQ